MWSVDCVMQKRQTQIEQDKRELTSLENQINESNSLHTILSALLSEQGYPTTTIFLKSFTPNDEYGVTHEVHGLTLSDISLSALLTDLESHKYSLIRKKKSIEAKYQE